MKNKTKKIGAEAFEEYYCEKLGERWCGLKKALLQESKTIAYTKNLKKTYYLDYASIQAASALPALEKGLCLDMCAAPGGKTLVLSNIMGKDVLIQANEISAARRNRLIKVLDETLEASVAKRITVTGFDAAKMPKFIKTKYNRILLDAPCSSERHVLQSLKYLNEWSKARIRNLNIRQWSLLSAAFLMLEQGGFLVYSTCAVLEDENDCIIDRLLKKYKNAFIINSFTVSEENKENIIPEKTRNGFIYLPDKSCGTGPLYFSICGKS